MKIHFSHVICMLFFFYIFAMSHHRTQSNFYLSTTRMCVCVYVQYPLLILAPLVNMSKGGCENKSASLIFHSKDSQKDNLSLK